MKALQTKCALDLEGYFQGWRNESMSASEFNQTVQARLRKLWLEAWLTGARSRVWWRDTVSGQERKVLDWILGRQLAFWSNFVIQLETRSQAGQAFGPKDIARLRSYVLPARGAMEWALVMNTPNDHSIEWNLGPPREGSFAHGHCPDCVNLAETKTFTPLTLPTVPGEARTQCGIRCTCQMVIHTR